MEPSRSVDRTFSILEYLVQEKDRVLSLGEIARENSLTKPTCARLLEGLTQRQYAIHLGKRMGYALGPRLTELTGRGSRDSLLIAAARPIMLSISKRTAERTVLVTMGENHTRRILAETVASEAEMEFRETDTTMNNLLETATGRVIWALSRTISGNTPSDEWSEHEKDLHREITASLKRHSFYITIRNNLAALAGPIDRDQQPPAALGIFLNARHNTGETRRLVEKELVRGLKMISGVFGESRVMPRGRKSADEN